MMAFGVLVVSLPVILLAIVLGGAWMEGRRSPYAFGLGRVLSNSFGAIGGAPLAFLAASFVVNAPPSLAQPLFAGGVDRLWLPLGGIGLAWIVLWPFLQLFMVSLALDTLAGRATDPRAAMALAGRRLLPALAIILLSGLGIGVGFLMLVIPGIILLLNWFVVLPVLAGEGRGIFDCFARSNELMRGMRWRLLLLLIIVLVLWTLFAGLGQVLGLALGGDNPGWISAVIEAIVGTLTGTLQAAGGAAVYHEVRTAKEGMGSHDLEAVFA